MAAISVIIPLYNGSQYIEEAIRSVFTQDRPADEIVVVDDGSTDGGAEIVLRLAKERPIKLLTKENGGQGSARNFGVAASSGTLIAFLDQDDIWYSHHLRKLEELFLKRQDTPLGWVYSDADHVDDQGTLVCRSMLTTLGLNEHPKRNLERCLAQDMYILPGAAMISREAFDAVGGFDARLVGYEDDDLFLRLFCAGYHNEFVSEALLKWRIHSASASFTGRMLESRALYFENLVKLFPDEPGLGRFYIRDLVAPRFSAAFAADFIRGVRKHDHDAAALAFDRLERVECFRPSWRRSIIKFIVRICGLPSFAIIVEYLPRSVLRFGFRLFRQLD